MNRQVLRELSDVATHLDKVGLVVSAARLDNIIKKLASNSEIGQKFRKSAMKIDDYEIINLTPHTVRVQVDDEIIEFPSEGVARCSTKSEELPAMGNIPICRTSFGDVEGLPEEKEGTYYLVSSLVASHPSVKDRKDLLVPDTSPQSVIRDEAGNIFAVKKLRVAN